VAESALNGNPAVSPSGVREQLDRILASKGFTSSASLSKFLRHIVRETLDGRPDGLKEFNLGIEIFARGSAFDPRMDPIVRVQARNLRSKLERYYAGPGGEDSVRIDLPKGCYVPTFALRAASAAAPVGSQAPGEIMVAALEASANGAATAPAAAPATGAVTAPAAVPTPAAATTPAPEPSALPTAKAHPTSAAHSTPAAASTAAAPTPVTALTIATASVVQEAPATTPAETRQTEDRSRWSVPGWVVASLCLAGLLGAGLLYQRQRDGMSFAKGAADRVASAEPAVEARTLYVRGRYLLDRQSEESLHRGLACFREAVEIAPNYAAAWAGVADAYDLLSQFGFMAPVDGMAEARRAANKALSLDPSLAEAHIAMAAVLEAYDWNWKGAEREYKRAIELNPSLAGAHAWYGMFLRDRGRVKEAIPELELAYRLDPVSMITLVNLSTAYAMNGDLQSAIRHVKICVEIEPLSPKPMLMLAGLYRKSKQDDMARQTFERARELMGHNPHGLSSIAAVYASTGRKAEAEKVLEQVRGMARVRYVSPYDIAMVYMAMQQYDQAVPYLEAAYRERSTGMIFLCERKYSQAYRASRRFRELLSRLRLDG